MIFFADERMLPVRITQDCSQPRLMLGRIARAHFCICQNTEFYDLFQEKLSHDDRLILENMTSRSYRTYAVKEGESIDGIISSRGISREEVDELNPGSDLDSLAARVVIKLPAHKYSAREEHELHGGLGLHTLRPGTWFSNTVIAGTTQLHCMLCQFQSGHGSCMAFSFLLIPRMSGRLVLNPQDMTVSKYLKQTSRLISNALGP